jgi:cytochrome c-type biogenesis protein CcmE
MRSRLRFVVALAVAVALGGWLAYTSLGGTLETYAGPADLAPGKVYRLNGNVGPGVTKDPAGAANTREGLTFTVVDKTNPAATVEVLYRGSVPDQFREAREVVVTGEMKGGVFVARNDSLITLCPSKFTAADIREAGTS